jgi:hypothetical protein
MGTWSKLKLYFDVNTDYVGAKAKLVLFPWTTKAWGRQVSHDGSHVPASKENVNAPDL